MPIKLIVKQPFDTFAIGDEIADPEKVRSVLDSENETHVVKTQAPDPDPAPTRASPPASK